MGAPSLLELFRVLASFEPPRVPLADAPWEGYVDWAIAQGLGPLAAYNLEYRMAGAGAPQWARDRLLSVHQGTLNDNVMKLVNFKRAIGELEGRRVVLLGAASFAESLYPHVAFRPVEGIHLWVSPTDVAGLAGFLGEAEFKARPGRAGEEGAVQVLSDGRTDVYLHGKLLGDAAQDEALRARALPFRVYGPSLFRLDAEDAALIACLEHAREGYSFALVSLVDLRELVLGAPQGNGPYTRPLNAELVKARARAWKLDRALYVSTALLARLFPETAEIVQTLQPPLRAATRLLLDRIVVKPVSELGQLTVVRGADRVRRLLTGGR